MVVVVAVEVTVAVTLFGVAQGRGQSRVCEGSERTGQQQGPLDGTAAYHSGLEPLTAAAISIT